MRKTVLLSALIVALGLAVAGQVAPLGIIVEPPAPEGLTVRVWMDKPVYTIGESVQVNFQLSKAAYIYIWDIEPTGTVRQILPNQYDTSNHFQAGAHRIPSPTKTYRLSVTPPTGTEWLQIMAVTTPITGVFGTLSTEIPFPVLGQSPSAWSAQLRVRIQGVVPEQANRAYDFTKFEIISGPAPRSGTLQVNTTPSAAELYIDGVFRSWTPRSIVLTAGYHDIEVRKAGYQDHTTRMYVRSGVTQSVNVTLTAILANQPPIARFAVSPSSPQVGEIVRLDASMSVDADGSITNYQWDFNGDGIIDRTGRTTTWQYAFSGTAVVRLIVTDNRGATGQSTQTLPVRAVNQPPVASFYVTPIAPAIWSQVTFDAGASYDPDGTIASYRWDLDGDGTIDYSGVIARRTYYAPATYWVTLFVTDNAGAMSSRSLPVIVGPPATPGMPAMGNVPGIYIWGADSWRITVNGSPLWSSPRKYRIELRTDGVFLSATSSAGVAPMGLTPVPVNQGWKLTLEGTIGANAVTYSFQAAGSSSIYMDLALDTDGDGYVNQSTGFVRLGQSMVASPRNPVVIGKPEGYFGALTPSLNYRLGTPVVYSEASRVVFFFTTIWALAGAQ
jgi:PKD repeat protein